MYFMAILENVRDRDLGNTPAERAWSRVHAKYTLGFFNRKIVFDTMQEQCLFFNCLFGVSTALAPVLFCKPRPEKIF